MLVCAHGNVTEYCDTHDMRICETWDGDIKEYSGACRVLVTDSDISRYEYYFLKGEMLARGIELVSTRWRDDTLVAEYIAYAAARKERKSGRRSMISAEVRRRICELRATGMSLRMIREDGGVRTPRGGKLSVSTILSIVRSNMEDE